MSMRRSGRYVIVVTAIVVTVWTATEVYSQKDGPKGGPSGIGTIRVENKSDTDIRVFSNTIDPDVNFMLDIQKGDIITQKSVRRVTRSIDFFSKTSGKCIATGIILWPDTGNVIAKIQGNSTENNYKFIGVSTID